MKLRNFNFLKRPDIRYASYGSNYTLASIDVTTGWLWLRKTVTRNIFNEGSGDRWFFSDDGTAVGLNVGPLSRAAAARQVLVDAVDDRIDQAGTPTTPTPASAMAAGRALNAFGGNYQPGALIGHAGLSNQQYNNTATAIAPQQTTKAIA